MRKVIIIGSGAVAAEVCSYIDDINNISNEPIIVKGFIDDEYDNFKKNVKKYKFTQPYLGNTNSYNFNQEDNFIFGFANIKGRQIFLKRIRNSTIPFLTIKHPSAIIAKTARIGAGNIIYPNCVIGPNAEIGDNNIFTSFSFISHDCKVGNNNFFATGGLAGNVTVADNNFFGIRATILPSIKIGSNNIIQAGMTIDNDVTDNETVFYKYKEKITIIKNS